jgi:RimJ/RimL family protein N-acetyltransferase
MIRALGEADLAAYVALRQEALRNTPLAFASSPDDDFASNVEGLRASIRKAPGWMIFGAFEDERGTGDPVDGGRLVGDPVDGRRLVGAVGLLRERHLKAAHKMHLWGMYVTPSARGRGVGAQLMDAVVAHARATPGIDWIVLGVSSAAAAARRLYERKGFQLWGTEPDALREDGVSADEHRMALRL